MPGTAYLLDSNILLRWVRPNDKDYALVNSAIDKLLAQEAGLCYTAQNLTEFWNVCTRPAERNGFGLSVSETNSRASLIEGTLHFLPDSQATHLEWRKLVVACAVSGIQVHDAKLAASMNVHGVSRILTFNHRDFARYPGIRAFNPADVTVPIP